MMKLLRSRTKRPDTFEKEMPRGFRNDQILKVDLTNCFITVELEGLSTSSSAFEEVFSFSFPLWCSALGGGAAASSSFYTFEGGTHQ